LWLFDIKQPNLKRKLRMTLKQFVTFIMILFWKNLIELFR